MKRHDYRQSLIARLNGDDSVWTSLRRFRTSAATAAAALLLVAGLWMVEAQRMGGLDRDVAILEERASSAQRAEERARQVMASVTRAQLIAARVAGAQRSAIASSNAIARIGNALPPQTWLTTLSATSAGNWTIAGRSTRVTEIGTTLEAIAHIDSGATAHLVSITASGRSGSILDFVISLERHP